MTPKRIGAVAAAAAGALALTGCAGTEILPGHHHGGGSAASGDELAVVKQWSQALARGDVRTAAGYFRLPSVFANSGEPIPLRTLRQVEVANASLSCGARFESAVQQGRYVNVLFRLVARPGPGGGPTACGSGVGQTARVAFLIRDGKIVQWLRVTSALGGQGTPTSPQTSTAGGTPV